MMFHIRWCGLRESDVKSGAPGGGPENGDSVWKGCKPGMLTIYVEALGRWGAVVVGWMKKTKIGASKNSK